MDEVSGLLNTHTHTHTHTHTYIYIYDCNIWKVIYMIIIIIKWLIIGKSNGRGFGVA